MNPEHVLVVGGTGAVAQATVESLLRNGVHTTIFTHSPVNVQQLLLPNQESYSRLLTVIEASYDDLPAFEKALVGHSRVFFLLGGEELTNITVIKTALVEKARAAGIQQVLDISVQSIAQAKLESISQTGVVHHLLNRDLFSRHHHGFYGQSLYGHNLHGIGIYGHGLYEHGYHGHGLYLYDPLLSSHFRLLPTPYWVDAERLLNAEAVRRKLITSVLEVKLPSSTNVKSAIISAIVQDRWLHNGGLHNIFTELPCQARLKSSFEINSAIAAAIAQDSTVDKYVDIMLHNLSTKGLLNHEKTKSSSELASAIAHSVTYDHTVDKHVDSIIHNLFHDLSHHGNLASSSSRINSTIAAVIDQDRFKDKHAHGILYMTSGEVTFASEYADRFSKVVDHKTIYNGVYATAEERLTQLTRESGIVKADLLTDLVRKQSAVHHLHSLSEILGRHSQDIFEESYKIIVGKELSTQGRRYLCKL